VNLFLAVRGQRGDGFHELVTVLQTVDLHDVVHAELFAPPGRGQHPATRTHMSIELTGHALPGVPSDATNLAVRAAVALGERIGLADLASPDDGDRPRTQLTLDKTIPVAGGMAGGSADAAAALVALNELWGAGLDREELAEVAADLGSDVPFCLVGGTALATGRGTAVAQVLCRGRFNWVVCEAAASLSTLAVYRAWDEACSPSRVEPDAVLAALGASDPEALGAALHNDLEPAAFALRPELAEGKARLCEAGAVGAVLSGSGPTLLALCRDEADAVNVADAVGDTFRSVTVTTSPAGGPELLGEISQ